MLGVVGLIRLDARAAKVLDQTGVGQHGVVARQNAPHPGVGRSHHPLAAGWAPNS